jgi:peptide/nickel transport system ATP-binding protein
VLSVRDLSVRFQTQGRSFAAVDRVSFDLERGGALAVIGESGSGKTTLALSLLRLLPAGARASGSVRFSGEDVLRMPEPELRRIRGSGIAMVFHDPLAALNPVLRIGTQIAEGLRAHRHLAAGAAHEQVARLLQAVGLAARDARRYPHQLSGGMRQRALLALALACGPSVLIADEPTSSLDAGSQAAILALLRELRRERSIALLVLTHDLEFAARLCDEVAVFCGGRIVERGSCADLLVRPRHPYTAGLVRSLPVLRTAGTGAVLRPLPGSPTPPWEAGRGCRFLSRCPRRQHDCALEEPGLVATGARAVACFHPLEEQ